MDMPKRSWAKSLTWRVVGVIILGTISYFLTKDIRAMTAITVIFNVVRTLLYYAHERIWEKVSWGKIRHPLEHIPVKGDLTKQDYQLIQKFLDEQNYTLKQPEYQI